MSALISSYINQMSKRNESILQWEGDKVIIKILNIYFGPIHANMWDSIHHEWGWIEQIIIVIFK